MTRKPPQLDRPYPRHRPVSCEEEALWKEAAEAEEQVIRDKGAQGKKVSATPPPPSPVHPSPRSPDHPPPRSPANLAKLDLHGHTQATAYAALLHFIEDAEKQGFRKLLVITGKGKNGQPGILRTQVPRWLAEPPLSTRILACESAPPRLGGEGAWVVRIRVVRK